MGKGGKEERKRKNTNGRRVLRVGGDFRVRHRKQEEAGKNLVSTGLFNRLAACLHGKDFGAQGRVAYVGEKVPSSVFPFRLLLRLAVGMGVLAVGSVVVVPRMLLLEIIEILVMVVGQHLVGLHQQEDEKQELRYVLPGGHQNKDRKIFKRQRKTK